jgi:hypothetical protein
MSKLVLLDARLFVAGADLSGSGSKIEVDEEAEAKKTTNWRSGGAEENLAGISAVDWTAEGQWEAGTPGLPDDVFWAGRRAIEPWSAAPQGDSDLVAGGLMYMNRVLRTKASIWGAVGEVASWNASGRGSWPLVRGLAAHASMVPRTAGGNGDTLNPGAVSAGRAIYANVHALSVTGTSTPSITVTVQSSAASNFASPTDRIVFSPFTAPGGDAQRLKGPITDAYWRVKWAVTGGSPSFLFLAALGIE